MQPLVQASRGVLLGRTGRMQEAQRELDAAIATYSEGRKPGGTLLRMLHWRGLLHLTEGRPELAQIDCEQARLLGQALGLDASVTIATHNIGLAKFYGGDLPGALAEMTRAEEVAPEVRVGFRALDRARVLLAAGLSAEARDFADKAQRAFAAERSRVDLAEALLVQAEIDLIAGFPRTSRLAARRSARIYLASGHTRGVLAARVMEVRADAQERTTTRRSACPPSDHRCDPGRAGCGRPGAGRPVGRSPRRAADAGRRAAGSRRPGRRAGGGDRRPGSSPTRGRADIGARPPWPPRCTAGWWPPGSTWRRAGGRRG